MSTNASLNDEVERFEEQYAFPVAGGSYRWIRSRGQVSKRGDGGAVRERFGFYTNIDEQKKTKLEVSETDLHWRQALNQVSGGM